MEGNVTTWRISAINHRQIQAEFRAVTLAGMRKLFGADPDGWPSDGRLAIQGRLVTEVNGVTTDCGHNPEWTRALELMKWMGDNPPTDDGRHALAVALGWKEQSAGLDNEPVITLRRTPRHEFIASYLREGRTAKEAVADWKAGVR